MEKRIKIKDAWAIMFFITALVGAVGAGIAVANLETPYVTKREMRKETTGIVNMMSRIECKMIRGQR